MPATATAAQLAEVGFLDGLTASGTVASQSYWDSNGTSQTGVPIYDPNFITLRKWYNNASGSPLAATSRAGTGGGTITYAFDAASNFTASQRQALVAGLTLWSDIANVTFVQAATVATADVRLAFGSGGSSNARPAPAPYATSGSTAIPSSDPTFAQAVVTLDTDASYGILGSFSDHAGAGMSTMVHEFGHLLGLGHAGPYNGNVVPSLGQLGAYDSQQWTAMSYIAPDDRTAKAFAAYDYQDSNYKVSISTTTTIGNTTTTNTTTYHAAPTTPMMLDILAIQQLYGVSTRGTFSGGQVFGFNSNIGDGARPFYDFTQNTKPVVTLWDTGGNNALDLSGYATASTVNLNPGTFSSAAGLANNIGIAFGTAIDTAIGGAGDDTFILNASSDRIEGGGGTNTVVLSGSRALYTVIGTARIGGTSVQLLRNNASAATETLTNIQKLTFADGTATLATTAARANAGPLFDADFYLVNNPDVAAAGLDPYAHYLASGWKEGRDPSAFFSERYYLNQNPDVAAAGVNPLLHYQSSGWKEGRDPSIAFSTKGYLARNADVSRAGLNPLEHYERNGVTENRVTVTATPHGTGPQDPLVAAATIYAARFDVAAAGLDPTAWFHAYGWKEGTNPDPYFDVAYYLAKNPDVAAAHIDPLTHYAQSGWKEGRNPSAAFSTRGYLSRNADVAATGANPLAHYLQYGQAEGRAIYPV